MVAMRLSALLLLALVPRAVLCSSVDGAEAAALASDEECQAGDAGEQCALSALQLRAKKAGGHASSSSKDLQPMDIIVPDDEIPYEPLPADPMDPGSIYEPLPDDPMAPSTESSSTSPASGNATTTTTTTTTSTLPKCTKRYQKCGGGGFEGQTKCCEGLTCVQKSKYYSQCVAGNEVPFNNSAQMRTPSEAPLYTYYIYRVMANQTYAPENVNVANLPGVLWYLHNEVVITSPRKFGIMKIVRWKIQTKAPKPLFDAGMNFGVRYAFDVGMCTGPWYCGQMFQKYGYFVGCNKLGDFPFPTFPVYYPNGTWYSLPGPCPLKRFTDHSDQCKQEQPGGRCQGTPTGTGTCTYDLEEAGEIDIDELEGIDDYDDFVSSGNREYDPFQDKGTGLSFWNNVNDTAANAARVKKASDLFQEKYPDMPEDKDMPSPPCDFDFEKFYGHPHNEE